MLKEAITKIAAMAAPSIIEVEGRTFAVGPGNEAQELRPRPDRPENRALSSLDALVKMVKTESKMMAQDGPLYIMVSTHKEVTCFTNPMHYLHCDRIFPYTAVATDVPGWDETVQLGFEEAMIALRTRFQASADSEYALKLLSDITTGSKVTYNDNGVATAIVTQSGIALQQNTNIRPIIKLRPYRTFQEVEQPESQFLIRVSERGIRFAEADGGMWKLQARKTIKAFLEEQLADLVEDGAVVIAL